MKAKTINHPFFPGKKANAKKRAKRAAEKILKEMLFNIDKGASVRIDHRSLGAKKCGYLLCIYFADPSLKNK